MLASLSGHLGNPGQEAYAASNTFLNSFAAYRHSLGLPASVIDIGIVTGVGYVAENLAREAKTSNTAHDRSTEAELLALVKAHIINAFGDGFQDIHTVTGQKLDPDTPLP